MTLLVTFGLVPVHPKKECQAHIDDIMAKKPTAMLLASVPLGSQKYPQDSMESGPPQGVARIMHASEAKLQLVLPAGIHPRRSSG